MPGLAQFDFDDSESQPNTPYRSRKNSSSPTFFIAILILIVAGSGVAVYFGTRSSEKPKEDVSEEKAKPESNTFGKPDRARVEKKTDKNSSALKEPKTVPMPQKKEEPSNKALRLRELDREAMALLKQGKQSEGFAKFTTALTPYKEITPSDCTPEEAGRRGVVCASCLHRRSIYL